MHLDIHLCGGDVRVTKHLLDGVDVGAVLDEVGSKGMAESMRSDILLNPGISAISRNPDGS